MISGRTVLAFLAGAAFATLAVIVWNVATPYARAQEGAQPTEETNLDQIGKSQLLDAINKARLDIEDPGTLAYYDKLIAGYGLDESSENSTDSWLPDIPKIYRHSLTLPFQEAGKGIRDKEIAEFYARFLEETGLAGDPSR